MTVKELIEALQRYENPDLLVKIPMMYRVLEIRQVQVKEPKPGEPSLGKYVLLDV